MGDLFKKKSRLHTFVSLCLGLIVFIVVLKGVLHFLDLGIFNSTYVNQCAEAKQIEAQRLTETEQLISRLKNLGSKTQINSGNCSKPPEMKIIKVEKVITPFGDPDTCKCSKSTCEVYSKPLDSKVRKKYRQLMIAMYLKNDSFTCYKQKVVRAKAVDWLFIEATHNRFGWVRSASVK